MLSAAGKFTTPPAGEYVVHVLFDGVETALGVDDVEVSKEMATNLPDDLLGDGDGLPGNSASFSLTLLPDYDAATTLPPNPLSSPALLPVAGQRVEIYINDYLQFTGVVDRVSGSLSSSTVTVSCITPVDTLNSDFTFDASRDNDAYWKDVFYKEWHEATRGGGYAFSPGMLDATINTAAGGHTSTDTQPAPSLLHFALAGTAYGHAGKRFYVGSTVCYA